MSPSDTSAVNGLVSIGRTRYGQTRHALELLDYEQTWAEGTVFVFKCYDAKGGTVYVRIHKDIVIEAVIGDPSHPLPDPNDDESSGGTS